MIEIFMTKETLFRNAQNAERWSDRRLIEAAKHETAGNHELAEETMEVALMEDRDARACLKAAAHKE